MLNCKIQPACKLIFTSVQLWHENIVQHISKFLSVNFPKSWLYELEEEKRRSDSLRSRPGTQVSADVRLWTPAEHLSLASPLDAILLTSEQMCRNLAKLTTPTGPLFWLLIERYYIWFWCEWIYIDPLLHMVIGGKMGPFPALLGLRSSQLLST